MRRFLAILVLALFSFALISPAVLASDADDSLLACCRRAGKHRCSMTVPETGSSTGPALRTGHCPLFPNSETVPWNPVSTFGPFGIQTAIACMRSSAVAQPVNRAYESAYDPAAPKRGPPVRFQ
jgi:hypothetical protein